MSRNFGKMLEKPERDENSFILSSNFRARRMWNMLRKIEKNASHFSTFPVDEFTLFTAMNDATRFHLSGFVNERNFQFWGPANS